MSLQSNIIQVIAIHNGVTVKTRTSMICFSCQFISITLLTTVK